MGTSISRSHGLVGRPYLHLSVDVSVDSQRAHLWADGRTQTAPERRTPGMEEAADRKRPPWRCTVAVQAALCLALYAAFSLGQPQLIPRGGGGGVDALGRGVRGGGSVAFLSVAGGARGPVEQARLLRQMETIAKVYEVKFVLDIAQFGEDDPLWQNGSMYFQHLNIPWFSTKSSHGQTVNNFLKKVNMPYDQVLDIIGLDTGPLQETLHDGKISTSYREQTKWLDQSLALTGSNWKIVVGYNPLVNCNGTRKPKATKFLTPFHHIFAKYGVNAYISMGGFCGYFHRDNSILYIGHSNPGGDQTSVDGYFLHRVKPLEMESMLINVEGNLVQRSVVHQHEASAT